MLFCYSLENKNFINTNINRVLIFIILVAIIIFPIFMNGFIFLSLENKKAFFSVCLFKTIKILGGYAEIVEGGIAFHVSEKRAILLPYKSLTGMKKKIKPLKDYHITKCNFAVDVGIKENLLLSSEIAYVVSFFSEIIKWFFSNNKFHLKINNELNVFDGKDIFNFYAKLTVVFNLLMILLSFIKIIAGKIIYAITARKQQNNQSN